MTDSPLTIRKAGSGDVDRIESLLKTNDLPYQDVRAKPECFFFGFSDAEFVGIGGVEIHGSNGLLRSIVVKESARGRGFGTAMCSELENYATNNGVDTLYLLTTTAPEFFRTRGYRSADRGEVPRAIGRTAEFEYLCPSSAVCLRKDL